MWKVSLETDETQKGPLDMRTWLLLALCLVLPVLGALACGPSPGGGASSGGGATAGMCPNCGGTSFDTETRTERDPHTGDPTDYLILTCRECGHSWRAPAALQ